MRITAIAATALKGKSFQHELGPLTVFVGQNMAGKTARLDAILLACIGHIPGKDRTNPGIFGMASGPAMMVRADLDSGVFMERAWLSTNGKVSKQERVPENMSALPLVMFDANDYFGRSEKARLQMVFESMNLEDVPLNIRTAKVIASLEAAGHTAAKELLVSKPYQPAPHDTFQSWLDRVLVQITAETKAEIDTAKRMASTAQGLSELALENPVALPDETTVRTSIETARVALETALTEKGQAQQAATAAQRDAQRIMALDHTVQGKLARAAEVPTLEASLTPLQADLQKHEAAASKIPLLRQQKDECVQARATAQGTITAGNAELARLDAEFAEVLQQKCCPTCATNKPTWRTKAQELFNEKRNALVLSIEAAEAALKTATESLNNANRDLLIAEGAASAANTVRRTIMQAENDLQGARDARDTVASAQKELAELRAQGAANSEELAEAVDHAEQDVRDARTNLESAQAQLRQIETARSNAQQLEQAQQAREKSAARAAQLAAGTKVLEDSRNSLMMDAFTPLLKVANLFATGILKTPLEYRKGEIGRMSDKGNLWVSSAHFSGAEVAITHAAISAALGSMSPVRLVLLDELGRMDSTHKLRFLQNVLKALENKIIDQCVAVDVSDTDEVDLNAVAQAQQLPQPVQIIQVA